MATQPDSPCFTGESPIAAEVARGVTRLFCRQDLFAVCEMPLPNGRRADLMAIDSRGCFTIVEIKVAKADLLATASGPSISSIATGFSGRCRRIFHEYSTRRDIFRLPRG